MSVMDVVALVEAMEVGVSAAAVALSQQRLAATLAVKQSRMSLKSSWYLVVRRK